MKKKDVFLVIVLVGLIIFLIFDLREGGSGISTHIAGAFRTLFGSRSNASRTNSAPAEAPQLMSRPASTNITPSVEPAPAQASPSPAIGSVPRRVYSMSPASAPPTTYVQHSKPLAEPADIATITTATATTVTTKTEITKPTKKH